MAASTLAASCLALAAVSGLAASGSALAAGTDAGPPETLRLAREKTDGLGEGRGLALEIDAAAWSRLWQARGGSVVDFPLPDGERVDFLLREFPLLAPGAAIVRVGPGGERRVAPPAMRFLRGPVAGTPDGRAVLALYRGRIAGMLLVDGKTWIVGPSSRDAADPAPDSTRVWEAGEETGQAVCEDGAAAFAALSSGAGPAPPVTPAGGAPLVLRLALDSTTEWCAHFGNDAGAAETYLLNLAAQISAIYEGEIAEHVEVGYLRTFCGTSDPYTDGLTDLDDRSQLLDEVTAHWRAEQSSVERAATHLVTLSEQPPGFAGGLARTVVCSGGNCEAVLCQDDWAYGVSMLPAQGGSPPAFEVRLTAHELGHNHSSPHTNCLQDQSGEWISRCAVETCGSNPWCQDHGCYPGPAVTSMTGTVMSTGCSSSVPVFEDTTVEPILRGAAEAAGCITSGGGPGALREETGDGLRLSKVGACPSLTLMSDDGTFEQTWGACSGCRYAWIKRFTPSCHPFRLTRVDGMFRGISPGRPVRVLVFAEPSGSGDPADASLVASEDRTVQVVSPTQFDHFDLATPVTVESGDLYLGFFDLQSSAPAPFIAPLDTGPAGDSFWAIDTVAPGSFAPRNEGTWMIRGAGGAVPPTGVRLAWGEPCNAASVGGQDFAVYRGDVGAFDAHEPLFCSTAGQHSSIADDGAASGYYLVVPRTAALEGSYGLTSDGAERAPALDACATQVIEACP